MLNTEVQFELKINMKLFLLTYALGYPQIHRGFCHEEACNLLQTVIYICLFSTYTALDGRQFVSAGWNKNSCKGFSLFPMLVLYETLVCRFYCT